MPAEHKTPTLAVWFPLDLSPTAAAGDLYGYFHPSTNQVLVLPSDASVAGSINLSRGPGSPGLQVRQVDGGWQFSASGGACEARPYDLEADLTSRHSGLLETAAMRQSGVILCGCGSVGSLAAVDLARSGVGRFLLIDDDLLTIENLCRHQCGLAEVGRFKAQAVADRIRPCWRPLQRRRMARGAFCRPCGWPFSRSACGSGPSPASCSIGTPMCRCPVTAVRLRG